MDALLLNVREHLEKISDEKLRESGQRFFKTPVRMYGTKTAEVMALAKESFGEIKGKTKQEIFALCEELWKSGYLEESFIACEWTYRLRKQFAPEDFPVFKRWIGTYVDNWASCDTFCNHSVGTIVEMYPQFIDALKTWAKSDNLWMRRAAAVSLIFPARKGMFLEDIFTIADTLLTDREDMVQKGYGWMLKAASQSHQHEVFDYVMSRKPTMPRTALRYAIEKMPENLRKEAMGK